MKRVDQHHGSCLLFCRCWNEGIWRSDCSIVLKLTLPGSSTPLNGDLLSSYKSDGLLSALVPFAQLPLDKLDAIFGKPRLRLDTHEMILSATEHAMLTELVVRATCDCRLFDLAVAAITVVAMLAES